MCALLSLRVWKLSITSGALNLPVAASYANDVIVFAVSERT